MFPISMLKLQLGGRQPSVKDSLQLKITFCGAWLLVEDDLWWKTTTVGRRPSVEPLVEDNLQWKMAFGGRQPSGKTTFGEDNLWGKMTFGGRQPLVEDNFWWKATFGGSCMLPSPLCGIFFLSYGRLWGLGLSFALLNKDKKPGCSIN